MWYYQYLTDSRGKRPPETVTSAEIAEAVDVDPTQVRKDLGAIGVLGVGRVGFEADEVCRAIRSVLGFGEIHEAIVVGAGHLGGALVAYGGFAAYGLRVVAAFDNDRHRVGRRIACCRVRSTRGMAAFVRRRQIRLAIVTTPARAAQQVTDRLVAAGVQAVWIFAPVRVSTPPGVLVRNVLISLGLSHLGHHLTVRTAERRRGDKRSSVLP